MNLIIVQRPQNAKCLMPMKSACGSPSMTISISISITMLRARPTYFRTLHLRYTNYLLPYSLH